MQTIAHGSATARVTWIDVVDPDDDELEALADEYGLADRTFDEAYRRAARPTHAAASRTTSTSSRSAATLAEIDMYLGPTWFITVRRPRPRRSQSGTRSRCWSCCERHANATITSGQLFATSDGRA